MKLNEENIIYPDLPEEMPLELRFMQKEILKAYGLVSNKQNYNFGGNPFGSGGAGNIGSGVGNPF